MRSLLLAVLVISSWGCGDDPPKKYTTYQMCFDDKVDVQKKMQLDALVECCIDHEIGGMAGPVCGADEPECINYLTINLSQTDADIQAKMTGCARYVSEKAMM